ncbi:MAG: Dihydrolipoamide acetyltransferase component of pyruvate dehydrogenase complex, partial [uncultured Chloroflexia bacterium]
AGDPTHGADPYAAGHRRAYDRGQAAHPPLLRHRRGQDGRGDGPAQAAQRAARRRGPEALGQRLRDEGVRGRPEELPKPQRPLHEQGGRAPREGRHGDGRRSRRRPHNPGDPGHRQQGPCHDLARVERPRQEGARGRTHARGVPGRYHHRLQHGYVRGGELHGDHQPAPGGYRRGLEHRAASLVRRERRARAGQLHEAYPLRRPPHRQRPRRGTLYVRGEEDAGEPGVVDGL